MLEKLMTVKQLASALNLSEQTIYNKINNGTMPISFIKLTSGGLRFRPSDVEKFLERRTIKHL